MGLRIFGHAIKIPFMKTITLFAIGCLTLGFWSCGQTEEKDTPVTAEPIKFDMEYPETQKGEVVDNYFGTDVPDPYRWLENDTAADVEAWVKAQNEVTFGYLDKIPFREKINARLTELWDYPKFSAPFRRNEWYFFSKNDGLQPQAVLYKQKGLDGEPQPFIDPNTFSEDGTTSLTMFSVSGDGKYAAYGKSSGGSDWNEFFVRNIATGEDTEDHIEWVKFSGAAWHKDGFFYGRFAEPEGGGELSSSNENKQIYYHKLGTDQSEDELVYQDPAHPKRGIYVTTTEDERFLLYYFSEGATNDNALSVQDLTKPGSGIQSIVSTFDYSFDVIENFGDKLLILTNHGAPRKRIIQVDVNNPAEANWEEIVPEKEEVLTGASVVGGKIFAVYLEDASSKVYVFEKDGKPAGEVELPGLGTVGGMAGRADDEVGFYTFTSFNYPPTIFKYNVKTGESELFRKSEAKFNPEDYETEQVFFESKDGTKVPMFLTYKKGLEKNGENPTMLYGYGGFNINILPGFNPATLILLENGGIYASVNLRGGGEYGEDWHKDGMLDKKQHVFDDFIAAAEYLIANKYTSTPKLAIHGRSNGGLLVGATMCQRPELFGVAFPGVGVMDMLRYHKFTIGHAWAVEYGSSEFEDQFNNLIKYSPVHSLKEGTSYPATMVTTADHDDRVVPAHSFKFAATLQEKHAGEAPVLIRIDVMAGHGAGRPTEKIISEWADMYAFMFANMGVVPDYK